MSQSGVTLLELLVTITIIMVLASVAMPLSKVSGKRTKEIELRQDLRTVRAAIDAFKLDWNRDGDVSLGPLCVKNKLTCKETSSVSGYPKTLQTLLEVKLTGEEATVKGATLKRYLRRIPVDPLTGRPTGCYGATRILPMRRPGAVTMCMTWPRPARRSRWMGRSIGTGERGFTLLELMSIVTIVGILVTMAVPSYQQSVVKAREAVLTRDLFTVRDLLDQHRADKGKYPDSLKDLVTVGYLKTIPMDPFTRSTSTWQEIYETTEGGVFDIHSGSDLVGTDGVPYNQW